ncbi:RHS repeat domain-containing protein [Pseudochryseolinea flava]|uniref:RHS repeat-associated core domain-containing protein n=1 Tax=Pseudochryseolinea flava TaxID=2059302 RepID=A0A364XY19_9BACT|nr:RHS repeat-associated core domain-containing protein [Pseudochryseolinea flava]RAV98889.1 hypothetical protein DQQ10_21550 [Pseudochryseolinea flava]
MRLNDYYPFGLPFNQYTRENTKAQDLQYNGKELQNEISLNWFDYGSRMYDPASCRWMVVDPLADQMRRHSVYNYAYCNAVRFVDPDGRKPFGDYYSSEGDKVFSDGKKDGKIHVVNTSTKTLSKMYKGNKKDATKTVNDLKQGQAKVITLPTFENRQKMYSSIGRMRAPSSTDPVGALHEEGGVVGEDSDGNEVVANAKPGKPMSYKNGKVNEATLGPYNSAEPDISAKIKTTITTFHVHPTGEINTSRGTLFSYPTVSEGDKTAAKLHPDVKGPHILFDPANNLVRFFDKTGEVATFPLNTFQSATAP